MTQHGEAWVKSATPEQIVAAQAAGELAEYLGGMTAEQQSHERAVATARDRLLAAVYGLPSIHGRGDVDSTYFAAKRARMDAEQLAKLDWLETAPAAEVFEAERDGSLDHLLGRKPVPEASGSGVD